MARRPRTPPGPSEWASELEAYLEDAAPLRAAIAAADNAGSYLHWDEFRHRSAPDGWDPQDVWTLVRWERRQATRALPLLSQKDGRPFSLVQSDPLRAALYRIDKRERIWTKPGRDDEVGFQLAAAIDEAHHSSAIEGAVTTRRQSAELIRTGRPPRGPYEHMVLNNFKAVRQLEQWVQDPLTPELLCEMQRTVTAGTLKDEADSGRFREDDDVHVVDAKTGETVFRPPAARELQDRMERLCRFANEPCEDEAFLHPITRAVLLHHQLAYDHPFGDGNGRTGRGLFLWSAYRSGYAWFRNLSISRAIYRAREQYYRSFLFVQTDGGDTTYFVRSQLRFIEQEIGRLATHLEREAAVRRWIDEYRSLTTALNGRQLALFDYALEEPGTEFTVRGHRQYHGVTQPTAYADLERMVREGLLVVSRTEGRGGKKFYRLSEELRARAAERPPEVHRPAP